jgi:hypothetical protein
VTAAAFAKAHQQNQPDASTSWFGVASWHELKCSLCLQRVAIKKQFFLGALDVQYPDATFATNMSKGGSMVASTGFTRLSVSLISPFLESQGPQDGLAFNASDRAFLATDRNMLVLLELNASVPLLFSPAHTVKEASQGTYLLPVRLAQQLYTGHCASP